MNTKRPGSAAEARMAAHIHPRPWSSTSQPGRKENEHASNSMHRVWMNDCAPHGRWTKAKKKEFYARQDANLHKLKPHDDIHARDHTKQWTHLHGSGTKAGGQQEKLCYVPDRQTGLHLKSGLYIGKYKNVKHEQAKLCTGKQDIKGQPIYWELDDRKMFDNRIKDDAIRWNERELKNAVQMAFDVSRPCNTASCPQLGADFCTR